MSSGAEGDAEGEPIEDILDTIGDRRARHVLASIAHEPRSAKEIAEELDLSLPTVYRRIEELEDYELVEGRTEIATDGNHYRVFECAFDSTVISLDDGEYEVQIFREGNVPDRFADLWEDLSRARD
ncbi:MAG: winged helix-turn-helix domain-containing protein [Haloferacaceae archaeon]